MYRKRMSEALREARAYTAINEVMVFKGGRGMNVSKQDLPVFKAKGWKLKEELEEANMKRLLQALQDKLSKEGGAAGFDDLKKTAKTMGVDLTPDMLKGAPGIKQHRDGDYILEGTMIGGIVTDSGRKMPGYDKAKKALKDFMSKPQPAKGADNKVMAFIFDDELLDDLYVASKKNVSDVRPIVKKRLKALNIKEDATEQLDEFTRKDFQKLETTNDHTEAAKKLIDMFGTSDEKKEMNDIKTRHEKTGYINGKDYSKRQMMVKKYYSNLK